VDSQKARVAAATVRLTKLGGQGVLVPGGYVLTATHCIEWDGSGGMTLGDHYLEPVETKSGARFNISPVAADAISDLAVLGALDNQEFSDDCEKFGRWSEVTDAVELSEGFERWCRDEPDGEQSFRVHALTHKNEWIAGRASRVWYRDSEQDVGARVWVQMDRPIHGGTSGGPIVDDDGRLAGIVSEFNVVEHDQPCDGMQPFAGYALPYWALTRIRSAVAR